MDVEKLKITQELFEKKNTCERILNDCNTKIDKNACSDKHFPIIVTKGANPSAWCLECGIKVGAIKHVIIPDASEYKEEKYGDGYNERQKTARLNDLRAYAINWLEQNPESNSVDFKQAIVNEVKKTKRLD